MTMYEVVVYSQTGRVLRKSLVQAVNLELAYREAHNVFSHTPGAFRVEVE